MTRYAVSRVALASGRARRDADLGHEPARARRDRRQAALAVPRTRPGPPTTIYVLAATTKKSSSAPPGSRSASSATASGRDLARRARLRSRDRPPAPRRAAGAAARPGGAPRRARHLRRRLQLPQRGSRAALYARAGYHDPRRDDALRARAARRVVRDALRRQRAARARDRCGDRRRARGVAAPGRAGRAPPLPPRLARRRRRRSLRRAVGTPRARRASARVAPRRELAALAMPSTAPARRAVGSRRSCERGTGELHAYAVVHHGAGVRAHHRSVRPPARARPVARARVRRAPPHRRDQRVDPLPRARRASSRCSRATWVSPAGLGPARLRRDRRHARGGGARSACSTPPPGTSPTTTRTHETHVPSWHHWTPIVVTCDPAEIRDDLERSEVPIGTSSNTVLFRNVQRLRKMLRDLLAR